MPKIVDHDQRRTEIVRLIIKVISEHGLNGTTVRTISRAGGFSSGVLSHYFSDKDEMIKFAFEGVADLIFSRIDQRLQNAKGPERLRIILEEHLPIYDHDDETAVALAFWEVAMHDPQLRVQFKKNYGRWRDRLRTEMRNLLPGISATEIETRVDFAVASTDGLLITFALDGEDYSSERRIMLLDRLMTNLGVEDMKEAAA
ncbi:TetR family transcriptional regulator C-terminal domain-containing protein [Neorhizobium galegae]|uniref:Transcriptional regulator n=2 Tax=Neorhizobium galegae bv. officinalis TaxID=323656 RepID=A0A0T7H2B5_NEOGA|nr:TetR family transcriptional regulator C-terminal domain-containing protein [Neorhizobium galegae]KAB1109677.1 TetR family transcriptional regulator [Neorhizobium galegae]MCQ1766730.1 TetR family transcriptional regulator C-terminal domain-containing protein [Neorhizobium galegae]MCQ1775325.1 TetR family transcriptional regulator C-terminal domain-containing protein [Neorhizobium galegae]MCQ1781302.1 TetR family transcriptional regulator C-terminal domain-containing protein [Neorhizobium gale